MASKEIEASRKLIELYENAFDNILERLTQKIATGKYTGRDASLLKSINQQLLKLNASNQSFASQIVEPLYNTARQDTIDRLTKEGLFTGKEGFDSVHSEAIRLTQESLTQDLTNQVNIIGRQVNDYLRTGGIAAAQAIQTGELTSKQAIQSFIADFEKNFYVTYKNGAKMPIGAYAKMAVNTTIDSSINRAVFNSNEEYGNDLTRMSWHSTSCPVCAPYQGRVYSISGKSSEYPALSVINDGAVVTYGTTHPSCRHRFLPYVEELDDNSKAVKAFSNTDFIDNRTKVSRERYDRRQKMNSYKYSKKSLERQNIILKNMPKSDSITRQIEKNNKKIAFREEKIKETKQWDIDNPKTDKDLFIKLPPK